MRAAVFEYLATSSIAMVSPRIPAPAPAELGRDAQAEQAGVAEHLEQVLRVLAGLVDLPGPGLDLVLGDPAARGLQLAQLLGEFEVHAPDRTPALRTGSPRRTPARRPSLLVRAVRGSSRSLGWPGPARRASSPRSPGIHGAHRRCGRCSLRSATHSRSCRAPLRLAQSPTAVEQRIGHADVAIPGCRPEPDQGDDSPGHHVRTKHPDDRAVGLGEERRHAGPAGVRLGPGSQW